MKGFLYFLTLILISQSKLEKFSRFLISKTLTDVIKKIYYENELKFNVIQFKGISEVVNFLKYIETPIQQNFLKNSNFLENGLNKSSVIFTKSFDDVLEFLAMT